MKTLFLLQPSLQASNNALAKHFFSIIMGVSIVTITGCQTTTGLTSPYGKEPTRDNISAPKIVERPVRLQSFNIRGKIGITTPQTSTQQAQSGSAFYAWAQEEDRFAIDLTGALGIGHTIIQYDGETATLVSERTGEVKADNPEELLTKATGWSAPISQFSYWISGSPAPSDDNNVIDDYGRIETAYNGDWTAHFSYNTPAAEDYLPSKIKVTRTDGYRVIIIIDHAIS